MSEQKVQEPQKEIELEKKEVTLNDLYQRLTKLESVVSELSQLFKEKIDRDETKRKLIETMIAQLQKYEKDFIFDKFQKRIFLDLIQLIDRIDTMKQAALNESEDFKTNLKSLQDEIVFQILRRQGVELMEETPKRFNEEFQEAIDQEFTSNPEDDNIIIRVEKKGFTYQGRLLRPQMVVVAKYRKEGGEDG